MNAETLYHAGQPLGRLTAESEVVGFRFRPFQHQERYRDLMDTRFNDPEDARQAVTARHKTAA